MEGLEFEKKFHFMLFRIKTLYKFCEYRYSEFKRDRNFAFIVI